MHLFIAHSGREGVWGCDLSVQQSDGLGEETVPQSVGVSPGGPVSSTRGQEGEQAVVGVCRVLNDPQGLPEAPLGVKLLQAGQLAPGDVLGRAHHPFQRLTVHVGAVAIPGGEAACQESLYGAPVEVPEDLWFQSEMS